MNDVNFPDLPALGWEFVAADLPESQVLRGPTTGRYDENGNEIVPADPGMEPDKVPDSWLGKAGQIFHAAQDAPGDTVKAMVTGGGGSFVDWLAAAGMNVITFLIAAVLVLGGIYMLIKGSQKIVVAVNG